MRKYLLKTVLAISCVLPSVAFGNYTVAPVKIHIKEGSTMSSITLSNNDDRETHFQITIYPLHKDEESNTKKLGDKETKDLIASPAMFKIKGKKDQVIRIAVKDPKSATTQKYYAVSVKELPHKENKSDTNVVQFVTDFRVPVVVGEDPDANKNNTDTKQESDAKNIIETKYMADAKHEEHKHEAHDKHEEPKHEEHNADHQEHEHEADEANKTHNKKH